jgi:hypothetical protein
MNGKKRFLGVLARFSLGVVFLSLASFAPAEAFETWTGSFSFTIKATSLEEDNSGNEKFFTSNQAFTGTMSLFMGEDGLKANGEGCYLKLHADDDTTVCIKNISGISTESIKSKSEKALLVGTGEFKTWIEGRKVEGLVYADLQATLKQDSFNNLVSISLKGKLGGGSNLDLIFSATLSNITLTR